MYSNIRPMSKADRGCQSTPVYATYHRRTRRIEQGTNVFYPIAQKWRNIRQKWRNLSHVDSLQAVRRGKRVWQPLTQGFPSSILVVSPFSKEIAMTYVHANKEGHPMKPEEEHTMHHAHDEYGCIWTDERPCREPALYPESDPRWCKTHYRIIVGRGFPVQAHANSTPKALRDVLWMGVGETPASTVAKKTGWSEGAIRDIWHAVFIRPGKECAVKGCERRVGKTSKSGLCSLHTQIRREGGDPYSYSLDNIKVSDQPINLGRELRKWQRQARRTWPLWQPPKPEDPEPQSGRSAPTSPKPPTDSEASAQTDTPSHESHEYLVPAVSAAEEDGQVWVHMEVCVVDNTTSPRPTIQAKTKFRHRLPMDPDSWEHYPPMDPGPPKTPTPSETPETLEPSKTHGEELLNEAPQSKADTHPKPKRRPKRRPEPRAKPKRRPKKKEPKPKKECKVEGCNKFVVQRDLCAGHLYRLRKHNDLYEVVPLVRKYTGRLTLEERRKAIQAEAEAKTRRVLPIPTVWKSALPQG